MELKEKIRSAALGKGFVRVRILAPFEPGSPVAEGKGLRKEVFPAGGPDHIFSDNYRRGASSLLMAALPYGNIPPAGEPLAGGPGSGSIALFARRNYYREAVRLLQALAVKFRGRYGGVRSDYRILCNSPVPEKPLAQACGLGAPGRNSLIITPEAGSLVIIAAMTLPMALETDSPVTEADITGEAGGEGGRGNYPGEDPFPFCRACSRERPPCKRACPTGAIRGNGEVDLEYCIQWYASGNGTVIPPEVVRCWGRRLYGCTECQDACIKNRGLIRGVQTNKGPLPAYMDCRELLAASDGELKARFKGTAMGLSWLGPEGIRRNARLAWEKRSG